MSARVAADGDGIVATGAVDTDRIADAVLGCPGVAQLHGGRFGEIATYLPGRRVSGIRVDPTAPAVEVHVVGRYPASVAEIDRQVRTALLPVVGGARVTWWSATTPAPPNRRRSGRPTRHPPPASSRSLPRPPPDPPGRPPTSPDVRYLLVSKDVTVMSLSTNTQIGLIAGLLLAIAGIVGGFGGFVLALILGAIGLAVGRWLDGDLDLSELSERSGLSGRGRDKVR